MKNKTIKTFLFACFIFIPNLSNAVINERLFSQVQKQIEKLEEQPVQKLKIKPCDPNNNIYLAIYKIDDDWWYNYTGFNVKGDRVNIISPINNGHDVRSVKCVNLTDQTEKFWVEEFSSTHMGNGFYTLRSLDSSKTAIGTYAWDDNSHDLFIDQRFGNVELYKTIENSHLKAFYTDLNQDGHTDVLLKGRVLYTKESNGKLMDVKSCAKAYFWDVKQNCFIKQPPSKTIFCPDYEDKQDEIVCN